MAFLTSVDTSIGSPAPASPVHQLIDEDKLVRSSFNFWYYHERARGWQRWRELVNELDAMRGILAAFPPPGDAHSVLTRALQLWRRGAVRRRRNVAIARAALGHLGKETRTHGLQRCVTSWYVRIARAKLVEMNVGYARALNVHRRTARGWRAYKRTVKALRRRADAMEQARLGFSAFLVNARGFRHWKDAYRRGIKAKQLQAARAKGAYRLLVQRALVRGWDALVRAAIAGVLHEAEVKRRERKAAAASLASRRAEEEEEGGGALLSTVAEEDESAAAAASAAAKEEEAESPQSTSSMRSPPPPPPPPPAPPLPPSLPSWPAVPSISPMKMKAIVLDVEVRLTAAREAIRLLEATLDEERRASKATIARLSDELRMRTRYPSLREHELDQLHPRGPTRAPPPSSHEAEEEPPSSSSPPPPSAPPALVGLARRAVATTTKAGAAAAAAAAGLHSHSPSSPPPPPPAESTSSRRRQAAALRSGLDAVREAERLKAALAVARHELAEKEVEKEQAIAIVEARVASKERLLENKERFLDDLLQRMAASDPGGRRSGGGQRDELNHRVSEYFSPPPKASPPPIVIRKRSSELPPLELPGAAPRLHDLTPRAPPRSAR